RRERSVELERELLGRDVLEDLREVPRVERDRRAVTLDCRLDLALVVADLGVRAHGHAGVTVRGDLELDDVRRGTRDESRDPDGLEELLAVDDGPRRVARWQDLLVIRELPVDEAADEIDALEVEQDLVACRGEDDVDRVVT